MTAYLEKISGRQNLTIGQVIQLSKELLPSSLRARPWDILRHGTILLSSEDQLDAYNVSYGEMHEMKMRAALQNFPFDKLPLNNIEVVDWGCGQGLATLTLIDVLREHGILDRVKRIKLIEPSPAAIARAEANVRNALHGRDVTVTAVNKYLPAEHESDGAIHPADVEFTCPATIHLFSNILDIPAIDLKKTARILLNSGDRHFVVCSSIINGNSGRVDEFCSLLKVSKLFSSITQPRYASTTDTNHSFSCLTRGFILENATGTDIDSNVVLGRYDIEGNYDDYDRRALVKNGLLSEKFIQIYESLAKQLSTKDKIYIKPSLESDTPDLLVIKPRYGVLIVKVFEEDTNGLTMKGKDIYLDGNDDPYQSSPICTVLGYKKNLEDLYSSRMVKSRIMDKSAYYMVKTAVCFPDLDETGAKAFCLTGTGSLSRSDKACVAILGRDSFNGNIWNKVGFQYQNRNFDDATCNEIKHLVSSKWHSYKDGNAEIRLSREQRELAKSEPNGRKKIKGVAGSGKTQVLVSRAINCTMRTGGNVLILTYNITLANYIKNRLDQVPADFLWNNFTFGTYYRFITSQAKNANLRIDLSSYDDEDFFERVKDRLPKYDAILVDEVQDYQTTWMRILQRYFLKEQGEFVAFGDVKQNVYGRPLDQEKLVPVPNVFGQWTTLKKCYRAGNRQLVELALAFQNSFMPELSTDEVSTDGLDEFDFSSLHFYESMRGAPSADAYELCKKALSDCGADMNNTVILSSTCDILREVDFLCRKSGLETATMCETKEIYEKLKDEQTGFGIKDKLDSIRENKKHHFTMKSPGLKLSTIYSYKGWEAETVILFILPEYGGSNRTLFQTLPHEQNPQVIYTAITRSTKNLAIINLRNDRYGSFFKNRI